MQPCVAADFIMRYSRGVLTIAVDHRLPSPELYRTLARSSLGVLASLVMPLTRYLDLAELDFMHAQLHRVLDTSELLLAACKPLQDAELPVSV